MPGLYPVYDLPRQVATTFVGTKAGPSHRGSRWQVLQPAALRYTLAKAAEEVRWSANGNGEAFVEGAAPRELIGEEEEEEAPTSRLRCLKVHSYSFRGLRND